MASSIAQASFGAQTSARVAWKTWAGHICAVLIGLMFVVAGGWKLSDPMATAKRMTEALVPYQLSMFAAIFFGVSELISGVFLLIPRYRRWGALLTSGLLVAFMIYVGVQYNALIGADCSCFPWVKRAVGPAFFWSDAAMLAMAILAGWWIRPSSGWRSASAIAGIVIVAGLASMGFAYARQSGTPAPETITVNGKAYPLQYGKYMIYFFDPECSHCFQAAQTMAAFDWADTKVIVVPTAQARFAQQFLDQTKMKADVSTDLEKLRKVFPFVNGPYGVIVENGRQIAALPVFEGDEPAATLRKHGFIR